MRTLLENPTRYHVVQKQKNQVRQYLHESFRGGVVSVGSGNESVLGKNSVEAGPTSAPMLVQSAPPGPAVHHPKPQHPHLASYPHGPTVLTHGGNPVAASPDPTTGAMSPGLSSVATSNSEVTRLLPLLCDNLLGRREKRHRCDGSTSRREVYEIVDAVRRVFRRVS